MERGIDHMILRRGSARYRCFRRSKGTLPQGVTGGLIVAIKQSSPSYFEKKFSSPPSPKDYHPLN